MIDPILTLAHSIQTNKGVFAVLLGSGISRAAGIPTGWEITLDLARRLAALEGLPNVEDPERWYIDKYGEELDYSSLLKALSKSRAERRSILHPYFEPTPEEHAQGRKAPTKAHRVIARLVSEGFVKVILTTNFDRLVEIALRDEGIEPIVISTPDAAEGAAPISHQRCVVIKLHGDYLDDRIKNTADELEKYDQKLKSYLDLILDEYGLIICGWSGEWDTALRASIEGCKSRRYTTYWADPQTLGPKAQKLATLRQAQLIKIKDADTFFSQVEEKVVSLEELRLRSPISVDVAVASLKRYIVSAEHRIRLFDLLLDEATKLSEYVRTRANPEMPNPDAASFRKQVEQYEVVTELLRHVFYCGGFWAKPDQYDYFVNSLRNVMPRGPNIGNAAWLGLQLYPVALLAYSGGLGAVANNNYGFLQALFEVEITHRGISFGMPRTLMFCAGGDLANALHPQKRHTPMSDHVGALLEPLASKHSASPEYLFDKLETLIALFYVDSRSPTDSGRMPYGRYCWKERTKPYDVVFSEAKEQGADWPPLKGGMFRGQPARFEVARTSFQSNLQEILRYM